MEKVKKKPNDELVILVGIGAYLQNIYTGIENLLKQILIDKKIPLPDSPTWHKDLLNLAVQNKIISKGMANQLGEYLTFRHFFTHSYGFLLDKVKLKPLMENINDIFTEFRKEIEKSLLNIENKE